MKPPAILDEAHVLEWAWSGDRPFGVVTGGDQSGEIFGLAIARYENSGPFHRFSCNSDWEVVQDATYDSPEEAKEHLPPQYQEIRAIWHRV